MRKLLVAVALLSAALEAASIRMLRPAIPIAFEENRGQSPNEFRYVLTHWNAGFACNALYARTSSFPASVPEKLTFVGANPNCASQIAHPLSSYSKFYRGAAGPAGIGTVRHYQTMRFQNVWPGVDIRYSAASSGYTISIQAASPAAIGQVRLSSSIFLAVDPATGSISSPVGSFAVAGPVKAALDQEHNEVSFTTAATGPVSFTLTPTSPGLSFDASSPNFTVDPDGSIYFAANTTYYSELDTTSEKCLQGAITNACPDVYIAKFNRAGVLQYLVYLQGDRYDNAYQIESDPGGNIYVAGTTLSHDFPTTAGAYQERYQGPSNTRVEFRTYVGGDAFLTKLHGPTGGVIYSTLIGGSAEDSAQTMRVDVFGRTYLGLTTRSEDLPRKGPQVESSPRCSENTFITPASTTCYWLMSLDENGRELRYAQQISPTQFELSSYGTLFYSTTTPTSPDGSTFSVTQNALWSDGNLRYSRAFDNQLFPGVSGPDESLWTVRALGASSGASPQRYDLIRFGPDGESPAIVKQDLLLPLQLIAVDQASNVWLAGNVSVTPDAPLTTCPDCGGVNVLDSSGNSVFGTALPLSAGRFRLNNGVLYAWGAPQMSGWPSIAVVDRSAAPEPVLASVSDVDPRGFTLVPANVLALTGALIGPDTQVYRPLDSTGRLATEVGGYRVLFDGHAAPILAAGRDRLVVQVPMTQSTPWSTLTIQQNGNPLITRPLMAAFGRGPIILAGPNPPDESFVIRNEDGTPNSSDNPAALGSVASFLVAGVGETDPPLIEGELTHSVLAKPRITPAVSFSLGTPNAEVLSYQQAANQPAGIMEMRVRLPQTPPGNDPSVNWWALFFVNPEFPIPATSQFPLRIYIRR